MVEELTIEQDLNKIRYNIIWFIYLSVCISNFLSVYLSFCLSDYLSICLSVNLSICLSICLSLYLSIYLSVYLSIYLIVYLSFFSICLSIYLWTWGLSFLRKMLNRMILKIGLIKEIDKNYGWKTSQSSNLQQNIF